MTDWVAVEDRLPNKGELYEVKRLLMGFEEEAVGFFYTTSYSWGCGGVVTHWRPRNEE